MKTGSLSALAALSLAASSLAGDADAVAPDQLPPAVQSALKRDYAQRVVAGAVRDERNDYVFYKVTFRDDADPRVVTFKENGELGEPPPRAGSE